MEDQSLTFLPFLSEDMFDLQEFLHNKILHEEEKDRDSHYLEKFEEIIKMKKGEEYFKKFQKIKEEIRLMEKNLNSYNTLEVVQAYFFRKSPTEIEVFSDDFLDMQVKNNNIEFFKFLQKFNFNFTACDCNKNYIRSSFILRRIEIAKIFVESFLDSRQAGKIMIFYAKKGSIDIMNFFFDCYPFEDSKVFMHKLAIENACDNNQVAILELYLKKIKEKNIQLEKDFFVEAMILACSSDYSYDTMLKLTEVVDINYLCNGRYPFIFECACSTETNDCFDYLLERYDCDFVNDDGDNLLLYLLGSLPKIGEITQNYQDKLKQIYHKTTDLNFCNADGVPTIYFAIFFSIDWMVKLMMEDEKVNKDMKINKNDEFQTYSIFSHYPTFDKDMDKKPLTFWPNDSYLRYYDLEECSYRYVTKFSNDVVEVAMLQCEDYICDLIKSYLPNKERACYNFQN